MVWEEQEKSTPTAINPGSMPSVMVSALDLNDLMETFGTILHECTFGSISIKNMEPWYQYQGDL